MTRLFTMFTGLFVAVFGILIINNLRHTEYAVVAYTVILPLIFIVLAYAFYFAFRPVVAPSDYVEKKMTSSHQLKQGVSRD